MSKVKVLPSKNNELEIIQKGDQLWTTSLDMAEKFGKAHWTVVRSVKNLECSNDFQRNNFVELTRKIPGGEQKYYIISRDGFLFLAMGFTGKKAAEWKEKYISAFNQMERIIIRLANHAQRKAEIAYQQARAEGRIIRREETDIIQKFVEYATKQGSKNAKMY